MEETAPATDAPLFNRAHQELATLVRAHRAARKVIFVSHPQFGYALEDAIALRRSGWAGLTCTTASRYAEGLVRRRLEAAGQVLLPASMRTLLAAQAVDALPDTDKAPLLVEGRSQVTPGAARSLGRLFGALRLEGVSPGAYRVAAEGGAARARGAAYAEYEALLSEHGYADEAAVLRAATRYVHSSRDAFAHVVFGIFDEVALPERAAAFIDELKAAGAAFYRLGGARPAEAPPGYAAARFGDAAGPAPRLLSPSVEDGEAPESRLAVGSEQEVRSAFRQILEEDTSFDEVELAYAHADPYLALVDIFAEAHGVPITRSVGRAVGATRPGQALEGWLAWIQEGLPPERLITLLRGGLVRLDRVQEEEGGETLTSCRAATLLASLRYEPGAAGYRAALQHKVEGLREEAVRLRAEGGPADAAQVRLGEWERLEGLMEELLARVPPRRGDLTEVALRTRLFLAAFGPVDKPAPSEEPTIDQVARQRLLDELGRLSEMPLAYEGSAARLAAMLQEQLLSGYVRAERPKPGHVHVTPLESAGYAGRPRLIVLGLDADTAAPGAQGDAVVAEDVSAALAAALGRPVASLQERPQAAAWRIAEMARRHRGRVTLYASCYDLREGEPCFPAPLFHQWGGGDVGPDEAEGLFSVGAASSTLDPVEDWLAAYNDPAAIAEEGGPSFEECYPRAARGLRAARRRAAEAYTRYDGLLEGADCAALDPLQSEEVVSASRLEMLATTPYLYFMKYVLGVKPLDEPALEDAAWLDALRRGSILHDTFYRFMRRRKQAAPAGEKEGDEEALRALLKARLEEEKRLLAPPSRFVEDATRRRLEADALVFLRVEQARTGGTPHRFEWGFGFPPHRRREGDLEAPADIALGGEAALRLRGRIDRVDRHGDGSLSIWDYKTGSSAPYDEADPLQNGKTLQWALYAYAVEALTGERVCAAGYLFTSAREKGRRIGFSPAPYRQDVQDVVGRLVEMCRTGTFPMNPGDFSWTFQGYGRLVPRRRRRAAELDAKAWPEGRPTPPHLL